MKKLSIFCGLALCLGFVGCNDIDLPNPPGQSNPDEAAFESTDLVVSQAATSINLVTLNAEQKQAPVAKIDKLDNFPASYGLEFELEVAKNADFYPVVTIPAEIEGDLVTVSPDDLNGAIRATITKDPSEVNVMTRLAAYAVNGNSRIRLGGSENAVYAQYDYQVTPFVPSRVIEDVYYLVGSFCNWDVKQGIAFTHVGQGSVYDTPDFSVKIDIDAAQASGDGYLWKVVPASAVAAGTWDGAMGVIPSADSELNGLLVESPEAKTNAGVLSTPSPYLISINVEALTYSVTFAFENLWVPSIGTSTTNFTKVLTLNTNDFITYSGASRLNKQWWITTEPSAKSGHQLYQSVTEPAVIDGLVQKGGLVIFDANSEDENISGAKRMTISADGLYWIEANLVKMTYKTTHLESVSLVGAFNGWNAAEAVKLTPSADFMTWTGTVALDGMFKINTNGAWDVDFGGPTEGPIGSNVQLVYKGANMVVEAGTYDVTVKFNSYPYTLDIVKK